MIMGGENHSEEAGSETDPDDAPELDAEWFKNARPASEVLPQVVKKAKEQYKKP